MRWLLALGLTLALNVASQDKNREQDAADKWRKILDDFRNKLKEAPDDELKLRAASVDQIKEWMKHYGDTKTVDDVLAILIWHEGFLQRWEDCIAHLTQRLARPCDATTRFKFLVHRALAGGEMGWYDEALKDCDLAVAEMKDDVLSTQHAMIIKASLLLDACKFDEAKKICGDILAAAQSDDVKERMQGMMAQLKVLGSALPEFEEKDLAGKPFSSKACRGHSLLILFWATWSKQELDEFVGLVQKFPDVSVLLISLDRDKAALQKRLADKKIAWPVYCDEEVWNSKLVLQFGVTTIPYTILADSGGIIRYINIRGAKLERAVARLTAKK